MSFLDFFKVPKVDYPTVLRGYIEGPVRCESLDGTEFWLAENPGHFSNLKPFQFNGKTYAISHLQKRSRKGWLLMDPYIFHWWNFSKLQEKDKDGNWIPGTEHGIYFRSPGGWRWDVAGTLGKHWIRTGGYLGGHWD